MKLLRVTVREAGIRIHNANQLHLLLVGELLQETRNMPMLQPDNGDPYRLREAVAQAHDREDEVDPYLPHASSKILAETINVELELFL
jgi:hypothetical protein